MKNPVESKIIELEERYSKGITEKRPLEEMEELKVKIMMLKPDISLIRDQDTSENIIRKCTPDK
jgi:hypothetical protein